MRRKTRTKGKEYACSLPHAANANANNNVQSDRLSKQLSVELEELRENTYALQKKIEESTQQAESAFKEAEQFVGIVSKLQGKRIEADARARNVKDIERHLKAMSESDVELKTMNDTFDERVSRLDQDIKSHTAKYHNLDTHIGNCRRELGIKQGQHGRFQAERDNYERQIRHRESLVKESARRHSIRGFDFELDHDQVQEFMGKVGKLARDQNAALERARRETQDESEKAQKILTSLQQRQSAIEQRKENSKSQVSFNDRKIADHRKNIDKIDIDEGGKARLESTIVEITSNLTTVKTSSISKQWEKAIQEARAKVDGYEREADDLNGELVQATKEAGETARLDYLRKQIKESKRSLESMQGAYGQKLSRIVGDDWQPTYLENTFRRVVEMRNAEVKEAEAQRDETNRDLEQLAFRLNLINNDLRKKRQEHQNCEEELQAVLGDEAPSDYENVVKDYELNQDTYKSDLSNFSNLNKYYSDCLSFVQEKGGCKLCNRSFRQENERTKFREKLERFLKDAAKEETAASLKEVEDDLKRLYEIRPKHDTWKRLGELEIPSLQADIKRLQPKREELTKKVEQGDTSVAEKLANKGEVDALAKTVQNIAKYANDIAGFEAAVKELADKQANAGLSRGLEDIDSELKSLKEKRTSASTHLSSLMGEQNSTKNEINRLELGLRDAQSDLTNAVHQLKEKSNVIAQIEDLSSNNEQQRQSVRKADDELQELQPQVSESELRLEDIRQRGDSKERSLKDDASKLSRTVSELQLADRDISAYMEKNGPIQLSSCENEMQSLESELKILQQEQKQVTSDINRLKEQKNHQDRMKRDIEDNLRYRANIKALESDRAEIADLESHRAEEDRDDCQHKAHEWQSKRSRFQAEQSEIVGEMKSKDVELAREIKNFNDFYQDANYKYKEAHIKVEATKAAVEDLGRYGGALDKAIMQYHSIKMEEINRIIEELWRKTYQGTDVDTILIRSDNENLKGNKSYNYRVVMVKQDAEMDMRGRCSAGQKVLASIIIRLALAECFGTRCGVIALDEPTTNLDRDNIRALAESLHGIITDRKAQSNFQLVVITHDEEFLRYMRCNDYCDEYYRVSRDGDQKSQIRKQKLAEVM